MATNDALVWQPPMDYIINATKGWINYHGIAAVQRVANLMVDRIISWMKLNAKWNDVTGEARRTLTAFAIMTAEGARIILAYGVPYGRYLETMQAGRLSILTPAVAYWMPQFIDLMKRTSGQQASRWK